MQYDPAKSDDGRIDGSISSRRAPSRYPRLATLGETALPAERNALSAGHHKL